MKRDHTSLPGSTTLETCQGDHRYRTVLINLPFLKIVIAGIMKALVLNQLLLSRLTSLSLGKSFSKGVQLREILVPAVSDNGILVNVHAVILNPAEFKHLDDI